MAYISDLEGPPETPKEPAPYGGSNLGPLQQAQPEPYVSDLETPEKKKEEPVPDWSEIPGKMWENKTESALQFAKNVAHPIMHPLQTLETIGGTALGLMGKAGLYGSNEYEKYPDAIGKMVMDRYGSLDNFKKTLATDPVGVLGDFSALASGVPGVVGKVGRAVDPLNAITKPIEYGAKAAGTIGKEIGGWRSGAGPEAIGEAAHAGFEGGDAAKAFQENLRGKVPVETPVRQAMDAIDNIVADKSAGYKAGIAQAGLDQPITASSFNRIAKGMLDAGDIGHHKGFVTDAPAMAANSHLQDMVHEFVYDRPDLHTVEGLDALKKGIGSYRTTLPPGSPAALVANKYYDAVLNSITTQAPRYAKVMEDYSQAKDYLKQIQNSLSLPASERKLNVDTALRKLQSVMRNNVNTNYGYRKTLMEGLEGHGAPNLSSSLAGQALSSGTPRGLSRISVELGAELATAIIGLCVGHPELILPALAGAAGTAITSSPRVLGEAAYYAGKMARPAKLAAPLVNQPMGRATQQLGRLEQQEGMARGGAIDRALRLAKKVKHG